MIFQRLTDRQADVLWLICEGRSDQEIANELGILLGTARQYRYNILQRLGGSSVPDICRDVKENPASLPTKLRNRLSPSSS
jgi:DNA-binding NarL/FixJ family response regulator